VLGLLAEQGPLHGHQLRRAAERAVADDWARVSPGALYRELHLLHTQGLVAPLRTEQPGRRPTRTVYAITASGAAELERISAEALTVTRQGNDLVQTALLFGAVSTTAALRTALENRMHAIAAILQHLSCPPETEPQRGLGEVLVYQRRRTHLEAELRWLRDCLCTLVEQEHSGRTRAGCDEMVDSSRDRRSLRLG
jgi:DNA-binding PadR family transcriptional regulator